MFIFAYYSLPFFYFIYKPFIILFSLFLKDTCATLALLLLLLLDEQRERDVDWLMPYLLSAPHRMLDHLVCD